MNGNVGIRTAAGLTVQEVELPAFNSQSFSNRFICFSNLPSMLSGNSRPFTYSPKDQCFAYVHTLFHATRMLEYYAEVLERLEFPELEQITFEIEVQNIPAGKTSGQYDYEKKKIRLWGSTLFDETAIYHELGHALHGHLQRDVCVQIETEMEVQRFTPSGVEFNATKEAIADLFAAFFIQSPVIELEQPEPRDLSKVVKKSQVRSIRSDFEQALSDQEFRKTWPANVDFIQKALSGQHPVSSILDCPDPYHASRALSGPIFRAALHFGFKDILKIFLQAIKQPQRSLVDYAAEILKVCIYEDAKKLQKYLETEFHNTDLL